jgi:hypothetical protein
VGQPGLLIKGPIETGIVKQAPAQGSIALGSQHLIADHQPWVLRPSCATALGPGWISFHHKMQTRIRQGRELFGYTHPYRDHAELASRCHSDRPTGRILLRHWLNPGVGEP